MDDLSSGKWEPDSSDYSGSESESDENLTDDNMYVFYSNLNCEITDAGDPLADIIIKKYEIESPYKNSKTGEFESTLRDTLGSIADNNIQAKEQLISLVYKFKDIFPMEAVELKGIHKFEYQLDIKEGTSPIFKPLRRFSKEEKIVILEQIDEMEKSGIIRKSSSEWSFQIVLAPKSDGTKRWHKARCLKSGGPSQKNGAEEYNGGYAEIVEPIQALVRKNTKWDWSEKCESAFQLIKNNLQAAPTLKHPEDNKIFILSTDASSVAIGAVLEQCDDSGILHPIAYYSRGLTQPERNYMNYEREGLALVNSIKHFRPYLLGKEFEVFTDNSAVASLFRARDPSGRVVRWIHSLSEYSCTIKHRAGKENAVADYLSRPFYCYTINLESHAHSEVSFQDIKEFLGGKTYTPDKVIDKRLMRESKKYLLIKGDLCRKNYKNKNIQKVIMTIDDLKVLMKLLHEDRGHFEANTIYKWISESHWRPKLNQEVKNYVKSCYMCQSFSLTRPSYQFSGKSKISDLFDRWNTDFLGPFPPSRSGNRYICCFLEALSRFPYVKAVPNESSESAVLALSELVSIFGSPKELVSDNVSCYTSNYFKEYCKKNDIKLNLIPSYQPEWNGSVERLNRTVRYSLAKSCATSYEDWDKNLTNIMHGLRTKVSASTGYNFEFEIKKEAIHG
ncbi:Transposon Ty3-I Gag-Pol polyprotein [Smittium culicis]|uniref:Transposon Ty3-I Gag-Pol polyprotein n=1 Tax=Smittium culicis TaxID=133412 RepID=A0A1R1YL96_9FUNG|nr:Transposon Ty3-I Gag-Pol polyprotein [Smittium culicis]